MPIIKTKRRLPDGNIAKRQRVESALLSDHKRYNKIISSETGSSEDTVIKVRRKLETEGKITKWSGKGPENLGNLAKKNTNRRSEIKDYIIKNPRSSIISIAKDLGASDKLVSRIRLSLESKGIVPTRKKKTTSDKIPEWVIQAFSSGETTQRIANKARKSVETVLRWARVLGVSRDHGWHLRGKKLPERSERCREMNLRRYAGRGNLLKAIMSLHSCGISKARNILKGIESSNKTNQDLMSLFGEDIDKGGDQ